MLEARAVLQTRGWLPPPSRSSQPAGPLRRSPWPLPRPHCEAPQDPPHPPGRQLSLTPLVPSVSSSHQTSGSSSFPAPSSSFPVSASGLELSPSPGLRASWDASAPPTLTPHPDHTPGQAPRACLCFSSSVSPASACLAVALTSYLVFCLQLIPLVVARVVCPTIRSDLGFSPSPSPVSEAPNAQDCDAVLTLHGIDGPQAARLSQKSVL